MYGLTLKVYAADVEWRGIDPRLLRGPLVFVSSFEKKSLGKGKKSEHRRRTSAILTWTSLIELESREICSSPITDNAESNLEVFSTVRLFSDRDRPAPLERHVGPGLPVRQLSWHDLTNDHTERRWNARRFDSCRGIHSFLSFPPLPLLH